MGEVKWMTGALLGIVFRFPTENSCPVQCSRLDNVLRCSLPSLFYAHFVSTICRNPVLHSCRAISSWMNCWRSRDLHRASFVHRVSEAPGALVSLVIHCLKQVTMVWHAENKFKSESVCNAVSVFGYFFHFIFSFKQYLKSATFHSQDEHTITPRNIRNHNTNPKGCNLSTSKFMSRLFPWCS